MFPILPHWLPEICVKHDTASTLDQTLLLRLGWTQNLHFFLSLFKKKKNQDQLTITWCRLFCGLSFPLRWNTCCVYIRYTTRSHLKKPEEFCVVFFTVHLVCKSLQVPVFFAPIGSSPQSWKELDFVPARFILLAVISTDCLLPMLMLI